MDISDAILNEILRVLRIRFQWNAVALGLAEDDLRSYARFLTPTETLDVINGDPPDNRILECAIAAESDFIVSGDARHLLPQVSYEGIPIVKVTDFLGWLKKGRT